MIYLPIVFDHQPNKFDWQKKEAKSAFCGRRSLESYAATCDHALSCWNVIASKL
ncbi:hypothetical protein TNCV_3847231 [Trichonephila clavipes]|nr:hypothetical protein TNCV_3847231 [Trichonephila clavipes]